MTEQLKRSSVRSGAPWESIARTHCEAFGEIMPATTMVEVSRLIDQRMPVEIEADAIIAG